jgi:hypothetical protein
MPHALPPRPRTSGTIAAKCSSQFHPRAAGWRPPNRVVGSAGPRGAWEGSAANLAARRGTHGLVRLPNRQEIPSHLQPAATTAYPLHMACNPWRDPRTGQFRRDRPHPFSDFWPATTYVVVRLHPIVRQAVRTLANQQGVSVTHLVLAALEPVIRPVLPDPGHLQDGLHDRLHMPASPQHLPRLATSSLPAAPRLERRPPEPAPEPRATPRSSFSGSLTDTR